MHDSQTSWHALDVDAVFKRLDSSVRGLSDSEAALRLQRHGPNRLRPPQRRSALLRFLVQFHNILIYMLLAAGVITLLLQHWIDSGVIFGVVVINAIIGFIQEGKAEQAMDAIRQMLSPQATVLRDAQMRELPAEQLVPGDVVMLASGDKVPADVRLFKARELRIEEAALTGESEPVDKDTAGVDEQAVLGDRAGMAYSGTLVSHGQGQGVVVTTGDATEIGRISVLLAHVETLTTPLLRKLEHFGRQLTIAILALAGLTFGIGVFAHDLNMSDMFLAAVALAVAAIPEGLPAIITITLAVGVQRMARRHVIIRRLPAVETLGSVTEICSDKTGTLTRNEMTVQNVVTAAHLYAVSGVGYAPHGSFSVDGETVDAGEHPALRELARAALLCNDASLRQVDGAWEVAGDPTEGALLTLALKAGLALPDEQAQCPRLDIIPFESQHRFMATLHHDHAGHHFIYVKGAPERVLEMSVRQRAGGIDQPLDPHAWHERVEQLAAQGQRVLAIALKPGEPGQETLQFADVKGGLTFLGLVGIIDPPRSEVLAALAQCRSAGIRVKMITGDHRLTAQAIGTKLGLAVEHEAVTGGDLENLDASQLRALTRKVDVFARTSPTHKLRLVEALQADGAVVAMTGDGVNDAPALKRADIGVAMGMKGTEVAKEAAEMVLVDDNFASIVAGVEEGRTVDDNIRKAMLFILPTNVAEAMLVVVAVAQGLALPMTPAQILWVNMITAVTLALALAFEPGEPNVMRRAPRDPASGMLSPLLLWRLAFVSMILVAGTYGLFIWEEMQGATREHARTMAVNTLVVFEAFYLFNTRYLTASSFNREGLTGNRYVLIAIAIVVGMQMVFTYLPAMQTLFHTTPLGAGDWARIVAVCSSVYCLVELEKAWLRRRAAA
jgi:magnesium-transporting ATPase (P-type)